MLASFSFFFNSGEFLLHIPCWLELYLGSFTYTPSARFIFLWGVSLTHPMLALLSGASFLCGEFLLHIPCWLHVYVGSFSYTSRVLGSFSYTSRACFLFIWAVSLTHPVLASFLYGKFFFHSPWWITLKNIYIWGVSLTHPVLASCLCEEFLLHIPSSGEFLLRIQCWFHLYLGSFFYTSRVGFIFMWGVSLTHPKLPLDFLREFSSTSRSGEFLLHIPLWGVFFKFLYLGSFSYTSHAGFFFFFFFFLNLGSISYTSHDGLNSVWGVLLTHPVLASFFCREFLLHIPCWLYYF